MPKPKQREGVKTKLVAYRLPPDLIREVKRDAVERDLPPAQALTERLRESFRRQPVTAGA